MTIRGALRQLVDYQESITLHKIHNDTELSRDEQAKRDAVRDAIVAEFDQLSAENKQAQHNLDNYHKVNTQLHINAHRLHKALTDARNAIASLDRDILGIGGDGLTHWSIRDELVANIDAALEE